MEKHCETKHNQPVIEISREHQAKTFKSKGSQTQQIINSTIFVTK